MAEQKTRRSNEKYSVHLTAEQRQELQTILRSQSMGAAKARRARILLLTDQEHPQGGRSDREIASLVGISERQVVRIRQKFVREEQGFLSIERQPRITPGTPPKFDGQAEAYLVTLCCSNPPEGHERWTLQLMVDELCRLKVVTSVCRETVRRCLKKMN